MHHPVTVIPFILSKHGSKGGRNCFKPVLFLGQSLIPAVSQPEKVLAQPEGDNLSLAKRQKEEAKRRDSSKKEASQA